MSQRGPLSSTAGTNYYIKLRTLYIEFHIAILSDSNNLQLLIYMEPLANVVALSGGTGTAPATINFANVMCKVLNIPSDIAGDRLNEMIKKCDQSFYNNLKYNAFAVNSGVKQTTVLLTPFIRPAASLAQDSAYQFTVISNFGILDLTSSNCLGDQPIPNALR